MPAESGGGAAPTVPRVRTPRAGGGHALAGAFGGGGGSDTEAGRSPVRNREPHNPFAGPHGPSKLGPSGGSGGSSNTTGSGGNNGGGGGGGGGGNGGGGGQRHHRHPNQQQQQQQQRPPPSSSSSCWSLLHRPLFSLPWCCGGGGGGGSSDPKRAARAAAAVVVTPLRLLLALAAVAAVAIAAGAAAVAAARSASASETISAATTPLSSVADGAEARAPGDGGAADIFALRAPGQPLGAVDAKFCAQLPPADARLCYAFVKAPTPDARALAASTWRTSAPDSHRCSGLADGACLKKAAAAAAPGNSTAAAQAAAAAAAAAACKPLPPKASCGPGGKACMSGMCVAPDPVKALQTAQDMRRESGRLEDLAYVNAKRSPPAPSLPVASWGQLTVVVDPTSKGQSLPSTGTFLGTSHEWPRITDWGVNLPAFAAIFRRYGRMPIIRIGGASQDSMREAPSAATWQSIAAVQRATGARIIIGLPLWQPGKAVDMSAQMMRDAYKYLAPGALLGFELGNEPEFWPTGVGGYKPARSTNWTPGHEAFLDYWTEAAKELNPCGADPATGRKVPSSTEKAAAPVSTAALSGPSWGNVNTIDPSIVKRLADRNRCALREMNVHYYPYVDNTTITAPELLAEPLVQFGVEKFKVLQGLAAAAGYKMRVSETNSLFGGGRVGLSDTYTGALWAADLALAFANAGASGFHVHWGFGGAPKVGGAANVGVQTNFFDDDPRRPYPSVHAPFYGALFFVAATGGPEVSPQDLAKTRFAAAFALPPAAVGGQGCEANLKTWALVDGKGVVRVAAINKEENVPCNLQLRLGGLGWGKATVQRLMPGIDGLRSKGGITWAGQTYDGATDGVIRGARDVQTVAPARLAADALGMRDAPGLSYTVAIPALTAAVIEIPPVAAPPSAAADAEKKKKSAKKSK